MDVRPRTHQTTWPFTTTRFRRRSALSLVAVGPFALASLAATGCSSGTGSAGAGAGADNSEALQRKKWKATGIAGVTSVLAEKGAEVTATFAAGELSGSGGVSRYTAIYETQAGDLTTISKPAATLMAGSDEAIAQEQACFAALTQAKKHTVTADSLTLTDDQGLALVGYAVVQPTTLEGTECDALAYNNSKDGLRSLAASSAITATFGSDGRLAGNASINRYSTTSSTSGDTMSIYAQIVSTQMAGPEDLMQQEAPYLAALPRTATYTVEGDELRLRDSGGAALGHYVAKKHSRRRERTTAHADTPSRTESEQLDDAAKRAGPHRPRPPLRVGACQPAPAGTGSFAGGGSGSDPGCFLGMLPVKKRAITPMMPSIDSAARRPSICDASFCCTAISICCCE